MPGSAYGRNCRGVFSSFQLPTTVGRASSALRAGLHPPVAFAFNRCLPGRVGARVPHQHRTSLIKNADIPSREFRPRCAPNIAIYFGGPLQMLARGLPVLSTGRSSSAGRHGSFRKPSRRTRKRGIIPHRIGSARVRPPAIQPPGRRAGRGGGKSRRILRGSC